MSTAVTSIILVAAVSMMGAGLISWSNTGFAIQRSEISNQTASRINLVKESFVLEDVWFYSPNKADITIRNTGDLAITISKVYINNTQAWSGNQVIPIGNSGKILGITTHWGTGDPQSIWIKTARGSEVKQIWKS